MLYVVTFAFPILFVVLKVDMGEFITQFFGYNALTYPPMIMKRPALYILAAFLAPGISLFDFSFFNTILLIQWLVLHLVLFD